MAQKEEPCSITLLATTFFGWVLLCLVVTKGVFPNYSLQMQSPIIVSQSEGPKAKGAENASQQMPASSQQRSRKELAAPAGTNLAGGADSAATKPQAVAGEGSTMGPDVAETKTSVKMESPVGPADVAAVADVATVADVTGDPAASSAEVAEGRVEATASGEVANVPVAGDTAAANADVAAGSNAAADVAEGSHAVADVAVSEDANATVGVAASNNAAADVAADGNIAASGTEPAAEVAVVAEAAADGNAPAIVKEMEAPAEVTVAAEVAADGNPAPNADVAADKGASTANADVAANSDASTVNGDAAAAGGDATASSAEVAAVVDDAEDTNEATTDVVQAAEVATVATTAESGSNEVPGTGEAATVVVEPAAAEVEVQPAPTEDTAAVKEAAAEAAPAVGGGDFGVRDGLVAGLPHNVCGMERPQLGEALAKPHGTGVGSERYYYEGRWMTFGEFQSVAGQTTDGAIVCVVVHVAGQMPCKGGDCVLHFYLRAHDTDVDVLAQLVERQEMEGLDEKADFKTILDGGGNCGIAAVLFATQYPHARIVSVEPAVPSFNLLIANTEQFPNVMKIRAGLWNRVATLGLWGHEAWGMQVTEINPKKKNKGVRDILDGVSIPFLLHVTGLASFDFIKIDIEGSEKELFEKTDNNDLSFMDGVRVAVIEIHERFRKGAREAVQQAFSQGFRESETGEYKVYTREYR